MASAYITTGQLVSSGTIVAGVQFCAEAFRELLGGAMSGVLSLTPGFHADAGRLLLGRLRFHGLWLLAAFWQPEHWPRARVICTLELVQSEPYLQLRAEVMESLVAPSLKKL